MHWHHWLYLFALLFIMCCMIYLYPMSMESGAGQEMERCEASECSIFMYLVLTTTRYPECYQRGDQLSPV